MVGSKSRTLRHLQKLIFNTQVSSEDNQYTVHTARILQKPLSASALSGQSTPRPAKLSAHLGVSQGKGCCRGGLRRENTADCRSFG